jgi:hypothetical protein
MKQIVVFKTSDGKVFESELEAENHELHEMFKEAVFEFCVLYVYRGIDRRSIADNIIENADELYEIFKKRFEK